MVCLRASSFSASLATMANSTLLFLAFPAAVDKRYSIMSPEEVFTATSFEDKNRIYVRETKILGTRALQRALRENNWEANSLDFIITVSCTGIMIPSLDAYLINTLSLRKDIVRLPVTEMGCAAGISGLIYAQNFLKSNPGKRAAIVAVESPTATFQLNDYSMANMVSAAIFGDGAACVLLSSEENAVGPRIVGEEMYHFTDTTHLMGFDLYQFWPKDDIGPGGAKNHRFPFSRYNTSVSGWAGK